VTPVPENPAYVRGQRHKPDKLTSESGAEGMQVQDQAKAMEVVHAFSDEYSRKIILSVITKALSVEEISKEQGIPISTCYRRVHELAQFGIIKPEKTILQEDGKKYICYKSAFCCASVHLESGALTVDLIPNRDPSQKLNDIWGNVRNAANPVQRDEPRQVPGDCDLCRAQAVPCRMINTGDSNSTIFVCSKCEVRLKERPREKILQF
jgi:DNA-binding Lrp family transcriptional regulator